MDIQAELLTIIVNEKSAKPTDMYFYVKEKKKSYQILVFSGLYIYIYIYIVHLATGAWWHSVSRLFDRQKSCQVLDIL